MKYPKMNTIWKRSDDGTILENEYSIPELNLLNNLKFYCTEKIDGMNMRVMVDTEPSGMKVFFRGRTDNAQIPPDLLKHMEETFTTKKLSKGFSYKGRLPQKIIIYGEGYGPRINGGGKYRDDVSFIGFDIWIDGLWLEPETMKTIFKKLDVDYVPELGMQTIGGIIQFCKNGFHSHIGKGKFKAEGVVARTTPLLLNRMGEPIKFKLKHKDYTHGERKR